MNAPRPTRKFNPHLHIYNKFNTVPSDEPQEKQSLPIEVPRHPADELSLICELSNGAKLYLSGYTLLSKKESLSNHNITYVLNCAREISDSNHQNITYKRLEMDDVPMFNLKTVLLDGMIFIAEALHAGHNVLVHCVMGISRSTSLVLAYMMTFHNLSYVQSYRIVKAHRPRINPNIGFVSCLERYDKGLIRNGIPVSPHSLVNLPRINFSKS